MSSVRLSRHHSYPVEAESLLRVWSVGLWRLSVCRVLVCGG